MTRIIFLFLVALIFSACDYAYYDESGDSILRQNVYIVPETFSGDASSIYPMQSTVVELGHSVKFIAGYTINGELSFHDSTARYYTNVLWDIDGEYFNINTFRYTFNKAGVISGSLRTVDLYGDTLVSPLVIYVNTPESITLESPYDGFNQVIPDKAKDYAFRWNMTGIDEWETAKCQFFISTDSTSLWDSSFSEVDCDSHVNLWGPFTEDSLTLAQMGIDLRKTYYTFYWGVRYTVYLAGAKRQTENSGIFHFTTKFLDPQKAVVYVPVRYEGLYHIDSVNTKITAVSALGDTLFEGRNTSPKHTFILDLPPQSDITLYLEETSRKDFAGDTLHIDVPAGAVLNIAEVVFTDKEPPQVALLKDTFGKGESIQFILYDDGSGINLNSLAAYANGVKISCETRTDTLFVNTMQLNGTADKLQIHAEDAAKNSIANFYWLSSRQKNGTLTVTGPFLNKEGSP